MQVRSRDSCAVDVRWVKTAGVDQITWAPKNWMVIRTDLAGFARVGEIIEVIMRGTVGLPTSPNACFTSALGEPVNKSRERGRCLQCRHNHRGYGRSGARHPNGRNAAGDATNSDEYYEPLPAILPDKPIFRDNARFRKRNDRSADRRDAVQYGTPNACASAGGTSSSTTTSAPTSTTMPRTSTTTTTTTTIPASNGMSATGAYTSSEKRGTEVMTVSNSDAISALTVTIEVNPSSGETITYDSEKFSFTKKDFSDSESASGEDVSYTYSLDGGDTIAANSGGTATAVFTSNLKTHASSGDIWSVSSVSNGVSSTITGSF